MANRGSGFYDRYIERGQNATQLDRVRQLLKLYDGSAQSILDIGCGNGELLELFSTRSLGVTRCVGVDMGNSVTEMLAARGFEGIVGDAQAALPIASRSFDCVIAAELIEHLFDTDAFVGEIARVLRPGGILLLSTPNLAYLPNRVLLALGIQPLFTETSTVKHLGRWLKVLGQGRMTEGHTKIFTRGALIELLQLQGLEIEATLPYRFFPKGVLAFCDNALKVKETFAAGFALRARKPR